jgi:hypothetical protein
MSLRFIRRTAAGGAVIAFAIAALAAPALAHEERQVAGYDMEVGLIGEPVSVGDRSGLEFHVTKDDQPVTGLDSTLTAEVIFGDAHRSLPISARDEDPGWYESVFYPTAAGPYTFHITGAIEGAAIDESFTSSPTGFDEVNDLTAGQFPVILPSVTDVAADARKGADASGQATLALGVGILGLVAGVAGLGVALAARRKPA